MAKGDLLSPESRTFTDPATGRTIRQITDHPSIHHPPYYYVPAYDAAMQRLIFVSHRTGRPEIFAELRTSGKLLQISSHAALAEWSLQPSRDGRYVYFTDASGAWRIDLDTLEEECVADFSGVEMREVGMVGAAMGTTALSADGRWWAVPVRAGKITRFYIIDTVSGATDVILERDTIGHPEFHPDDATLLRYGGNSFDRLWVVNRDGSDNRLVYRRDAARKEWIVHETWRPGHREILSTNWPHGVIGVNVDTGAARWVTRFQTWHPAVNRRGTLIVADTTYPDTGLWLIEPDAGAAPAQLCLSLSSNAGEHWNTDHCPYDDGPVRVNAPQHTHPHPCFAPDDSVVLFTSDRTGHAQLYECPLSKARSL